MKEQSQQHSGKEHANRLSRKNSRWFGNPDVLVDVEELNIVEFPLALLSRHVPDGRKVITFEDFISDKSTGERIHRTLEISANATSRLPNWWDQDFLLALKVLTNRKNGWTNPVVEFSCYEILKLMRLPNEQKNRKLVAKSFDNWQGVRFKYSHWRKGSNWIAPRAFCLIQDYDLTRANRRDPDSPQSFAWSRVLFDSMQSSHVKRFDIDFYFSLKSPTARRACRFLEKRFYNRGVFKAPLETFCLNKLGMSKYRWAADYRSKLNPAYDELVAKGFLAEVDKSERYVEVYGQPGVVFRKARGAKGRPQQKRTGAQVVISRTGEARRETTRRTNRKGAETAINPQQGEVEAFLASLPDDRAREEFERNAAMSSQMREAYFESQRSGSELFQVWRTHVLTEAIRRTRGDAA